MLRITQTHPARSVRSSSRFVLAVLMAVALLVRASDIRAAVTPEQKCRQGLYSAAAKYSACQQKALASLYTVLDQTKFIEATSKCRVKYAATWPKLQKKAPGSTCDITRYTDNGTTVTDNLTHLQWEKKVNLDSTVNLPDPHDADNGYTASVTYPYPTGDGTAFTSFLPSLNSGCFAGQCDWRLPTFLELQTLLAEKYPCTTSPCIDPIFGPTVSNTYASATTGLIDPGLEWTVNFVAGILFDGSKGDPHYLRAVRGGL